MKTERSHVENSHVRLGYGQRRRWLFAVAVLSCAMTWADRLERAEIEAAAAGFLQRDGVGSRILFGRSVRSVAPHGNLWLVRLDPSGYIVFAGSDQAEPVPFFSTNDFVEPDEGSPFAAVLSGADEACAQLETAAAVRSSLALTTASASLASASSDERAARRQSRWESLLGTVSARASLNTFASVASSDVVVSPFLTAHWNQWQPYNDYAPVHTNSNLNTYRGRTACGCVATATAQALYHWNWPARIDEERTVSHDFAPDGESAGYVPFEMRFDGHAPFDWSAVSGRYASPYGDARGSVAESVRHPVARLIFLCGSLAEMSYAPEGSGSSASVVIGNAPWYQGGTCLTLQTDGELASDWSTSVAHIRENMVNGIPVQISIPGHAIVGHGWAESGETKYLYINYGWGGSNDGYYNLDDVSSGDRIEKAYVDWVPRRTVQIDPLPAVSDSSVRLDWHLPPCYADAVQGFTVARYLRASATSDLSEDFETTEAAGAFELTTDADYSDSRFLRIAPLATGLCSVGEECILSSRSVLTYDVCSYCALGQSVRIQARFDGGAWTTLSAPVLNMYYYSDPVWKSQRVFLGDHAGETAVFRITMSRTGNTYYPSGFGTGIDNFAVSDALRYAAAGSTTVGATARSCTVSGLTAGADYRFAVTPQFSDGAGDPGTVLTTVAGTRSAPLPGTETMNLEDLIYSSSAEDGVWSVAGANGTVSDTSFWLGPFYGNFTVRIDGALTSTSKLTFSYRTRGYYDSSSYDALAATFVDADSGLSTTLWNVTVTEGQTKFKSVSVALGSLAGRRGEVIVEYGHSGQQYTSARGALFASPAVTSVQVPQLPELAWGAQTVTALGWPSIASVSSDAPAFAEGFYRESALGTNVFYVTCSESVTTLRASPSLMALLPDDRVSVHALGSGRFAVVIDASEVPARYARSRMILTLAASDANGTTVYKDLSMRFSDETAAQTYVPEAATAVAISEGGLTVSVPKEWFVAAGLARDGASADELVAAAQADADGDGVSNWAEYVCGTSPTNATEALRCTLSFADGIPQLDYEPKSLRTGFKAVYQGRSSLQDGSWQSADTATHRFFRIVIEQ